MRRIRDGVDDRGETTILAAGLVLVLFVAIGLVVDGGAKLQADDRAQYAAEQAARAAGQVIDEGAAAGGGPGVVNAPGAVAAARATLEASGVAGEVAAQEDRVTVTTSVEVRPVFLRLAGVQELVGTGRAEARLAQDGGR